MESTIIKIAYDGTDLKGGLMEIRELAPALLAFADFIEAVNAIANDGKTKIAVKVKSFNSGSFGVDIQIADLSFLQRVVHLFDSKEMNAIVNIFELIVGSAATGRGIFWLVKKLKTIKSGQSLQIENGFVEIEDNGGEKYKVPEILYRAATDPAVRAALAETVKPIFVRDGISEFKIYDPSNHNIVMEEVTKETVDCFMDQPESQPILDVTSELICTVTHLSFADGKWRLDDGTSNFPVTIKDRDFLQKVTNGEIGITPNTLLEVEIRTIQRKAIKNMKTEKEAIRVKIFTPKP